MKKIYLIVALVAVVAAGALWFWWSKSPSADGAGVKLHEARISDIRSMVELSTIEIYEEVPVKAQIGKRHLVAKETIEGTIGFDLDSLKMSQRGDTVVVTLPPEKITLRESTRPGAYEVYDTWNDSFFGSGNFSVAEENSIKQRALKQVERNLYAKGYVRQARLRATDNLRSLLPALTGRPVVVVDPTPEGARK